MYRDLSRRDEGRAAQSLCGQHRSGFCPAGYPLPRGSDGADHRVRITGRHRGGVIHRALEQTSEFGNRTIKVALVLQYRAHQVRCR
jgi:hypothetical protein